MYPAISTEDLLHIPITLPSDEARTEIVEKVQNSRKVKKESKRLLDIAKRGVEMAIEEDERAALLWMEKETASILRA